MSVFKNVEVYVRICDYGYEGESLRFATVDETMATTYFSGEGKFADDLEYAPDRVGEELRVYVDGKYKETWYRQDGKWVTPQYSKDQREYGVVIV